MIIKKILILIIIANIGLVKAQYTAIPDACFEGTLIAQGIDTEGTFDGQVLTSDISNITELFLNDINDPLFCVSDLTGIEDFTSLVNLNCDFHSITNLDLTGAVNLKYLSCSDNEMETLIINQNSELEIVFCATNNLTSLDISQSINLKELYAFQNQLTSIDISNNLQIEVINLNFNQLTNFIAGNNINLETLSIGRNFLTKIHLSNLNNLTTFVCSYNNITLLELTNLESLISFGCSFNDINNLSLNNLPQLETIGCKDNNISNLNLSAFSNLKGINCSINQLTTLDIRNGNNTNFTNFIATDNPNLICIFVDNAEYSVTNWLDIDQNSTFVETETECEALAITDFSLNNISIYPNPTKDILFIENPNTINIEFIKIYNMLGQQVLVKKENFNQINLTTLKPAIYLVSIKTKNGIINTKIVKK